MRYSQPENGSAPSRAKANDWRDAASTMLEPIMYWQMTMNAHTARHPFWPKLWKNIWAMGCGLLMIASRSVPMQKAREMLMAAARVSYGMHTDTDGARTPPENAGDADRTNDSPRDSDRGVGGFLTDVYAGIE